MSYQKVNQDIASGQLPPVYLWHGEDRYYLAEALKRLKEVFYAEDPSGMGVETFLGKEVTPLDVVEAANTASFFSRRLVVVDNITYYKIKKTKNQAEAKPLENKLPETLSNQPGEEEENRQEERYDEDGFLHEPEIPSEQAWEPLLDYLADPNPGTCLVLISPTIHRGRKLTKAVEKVGKVLEFAYPNKNRLEDWVEWVQKEASTRGRSIDKTTAGYLVNRAGHHTGILSQELDKIAIYLGERQEIGKEDVQALSVPLIETGIFDMLKAVAERNTKEALRQLNEVLSYQYHMAVHAMIVRQLRLLLMAAISRRRRESVERFIEVAGIKPYEGHKVFRQAGYFTPEKLAEGLADCLETELAIKSSMGAPPFLLELMVLRLCRK